MDFIKRLEKLMTQLRSKKGCPWDKRQTHKSLKPYLLEESHEVLDAIDSGNPSHLREELGDLLLQVVFHAQLEKEKGKFDLQAVAKTIGDKLVRRHPHVFGKSSRKMDSILKKWEELKQEEKPERNSVLDGLPKSLPALLRAQRMQDKISRYGLIPTTPAQAQKAIDSEWKGLQKSLRMKNKKQIEEKLGELMFRLSWLAHLEKLNAETALGQTNRQFDLQFRKWEKENSPANPVKKKAKTKR
jgi:tetrapyrrole methylase family protein/MazG family protein